MNRGAVAGLMITLIIPVVCYFVVKNIGEGAVNMPRRYYDDSVITIEKNGKTSTDTVWHQVRNFTLTDQLGNRFVFDSLKGKIVVVNSFFTRCPNICPGLTRNIRRLQKSYEEPKNKKFTDTSSVNFLSLSIDPERDSVRDLKKFADRFGVNSDNWSMLTGSKKEIYDLMLHEFKIPASDGGQVDSNFIHSERIILLDKYHVVRGYYNGLDSISLSDLADDIGKLTLEKDKNKPSLFREYLPIVWLLIAVPVIVFIGMFFLIRNRKKTGY
ncbi:MAG: SCO family protein [Chitinophagaceae bacterium]